MRITATSWTLPGGKRIKVYGIKISIRINKIIKKLKSCLKLVQ
jgi:hypothetical protein